MSSTDETVVRLGAARPDDHDAASTHEALRGLLFGAPPPAAPEAPMLGRYRLDERIGAGGMGVVFRGYDPALDRTVAVKLVRASAAGAEMLAIEARAQARVEHPCVVPVHDIGRYGVDDIASDVAERWAVPRSGVYIVMRWVEGRTLDAWQRNEAPDREAVLRVFAAIGDGLQHVHERGLVHRDLKPSNVIIDTAGQPHVVDFGIAALIAADGTRYDASGSDDEIRGTPRYMAPEQHAGEPADPRSDQYSFALCLLEGVAGNPAFPRNTRARITAKAKADVARATMRATPLWLRAPLRKALDPSPDRRFDSVASLLQAITVRRRMRRVAGLGIAASVTAAAVAFALPSRAEPDPCGAAASSMHALWTPTRAAALPSSVRPGLQAYVRRWATAREDACRALLDPATQASAEGRMLCLDRMLSSFEASVNLLTEDLAEARAEALVDALPEPDRCTSDDAGRNALLLPVDAPGESIAHDAVAALERATALGIAGDVAMQLEVAEQAHALALKVDHAPLRAAAAHRLFWALWETDQPQAALPVARRALADAERASDLERVLRIQVDMVGMLGASLGRYEEALGLAMAVDARCEAAPDPRVYRASLRHNVGRTRLRRGDISGALPELEDALRLRQALGDEGPGYASNLALLGSTYLRLDRAADALEVFEASLAWRKAQSPDHPAVGTALNNVGITLQQLGRHDEALSRFEEALTRFERTRGPESKDVGMVLNNLGVLHYSRGNIEAAAATQRRAVEAKLASVGAEHPDLGYSWVNLGRAQVKRGALDEADAAFVRAHENWSASLGEAHPLLAEPLLGLAELAVVRAQPNEARRLLLEARTMASRGGGHDPEQRARMLAVEAAIAPAGDAPRLAREALRAWDDVPGPSFDRQELERWMLDRGYPVPSEDPVLE